jgi:DNA-binding transcriptional LysR family regulator
MDYTLHQLKIFLKVVQHQSITKAADELCLTQPAVSIQLKKLQEQFEVPLTEVIGRKLYVTEFGQEIAQACERILQEAAAIQNKLLAYKGHMVGSLKVSVVSTGKYVMPYFLSGFVSMHPGVDLIMDVTNKTRVLKRLERNEVDFALVSVLPDHLQCEQIPLMENHLFLVGGRKAIAPAEPLPPSGLAGLPFIYREEGSATRRAMEQFLTAHQLQGGKRMELMSNEAVKQAVLAGLGYSIMPLIGIKNELQRGDLHLVPVAGLPITSTWNLVWPKGKKLSPMAKAYLAFLEAEKETVIGTHFNWIGLYAGTAAPS